MPLINVGQNVMDFLMKCSSTLTTLRIRIMTTRKKTNITSFSDIAWVSATATHSYDMMSAQFSDPFCSLSHGSLRLSA